MERVYTDFLNEVRAGHLTLLLLSRIAGLSKNQKDKSKKNNDQAYTQSLFEFASNKVGASSSTCYSRLRLLRFGGFVVEEGGVNRGKGVINYSITSEGEKLLKELSDESLKLFELCKNISGGSDE